MRNDIDKHIQGKYLPLGRWADAAACKGEDSRLFFPKNGRPNLAATRICGSCTVSNECLDYAQTDAAISGIWGGTTGRERKRLRSAGLRPSLKI